MQPLHGLAPVAGEYFRYYAEGRVDAGVQQILFAARGAAQNKVGDHAAVPWMANAQAQAVEIILIAELRDDVAQPVMPAVPAALFELGDAGRQVEFVVGDQYGLRGNPEEVRQRGNCLAAAIHKGGRDQ